MEISIFKTDLSLKFPSLDFLPINNTTVTLVCDNGEMISGIISYPTDLPSICWPTSKELTCWNRLLSNISRIHVINNILNIYFHQYFSRAAMLAEEIRQLTPDETFVYTTHPWLLSMFFDCPPDFVLAAVFN
jgi:hypothetical protein